MSYVRQLSKELVLVVKVLASTQKKPPAESHAMQPTEDIGFKYIVLAKQIEVISHKQAKILKSTLKASPLRSPRARNPVKPLELVMIGAVLFQYLIKQKDVEIFAVSI